MLHFMKILSEIMKKRKEYVLFYIFPLTDKLKMIIYSQCFPERGREEGILRQGDFVISVLSNLRDHSDTESRPYGQPGPLPMGGFRPY